MGAFSQKSPGIGGRWWDNDQFRKGLGVQGGREVGRGTLTIASSSNSGVQERGLNERAGTQ